MEKDMAADCIFCKIARGEVPAKKVFEDDMVVAFHDINPAAPVHVVIVPKAHIPSVNEAGLDNAAGFGRVFAAAARIARDLGVDRKGYRIVTNTGKDAGQLVMHVHFHLMAGREFGWPPG
jgi:histidine triad (HIT) family protein